MDDCLNGKPGTLGGEQMISVYFTSGKVLELEKGEDERFLRGIKLRGGIKYYQTNKGHIIPLNSQTIELIEVGEMDVEEKEFERAAIIAQETPVPEVPKMDKQEAPKESEQEKNDRRLKELMDKSDCEHEKEKLEVKFTATKNGKRYFPVCSFCGHRGRFIGKQKVAEGRDTNWTIDDLQNATEYKG